MTLVHGRPFGLSVVCTCHWLTYPGEKLEAMIDSFFPHIANLVLSSAMTLVTPVSLGSSSLKILK